MKTKYIIYLLILSGTILNLKSCDESKKTSESKTIKVRFYIYNDFGGLKICWKDMKESDTLEDLIKRSYCIDIYKATGKFKNKDCYEIFTDFNHKISEFGNVTGTDFVAIDLYDKFK